MNIVLSRIQFFLFLFIIIVGTVFVTFQSSIITFGGRDAWLIFLFMGILFYFQILLYERYYKYFELGVILQWLYKLNWLYVNILLIAYVDYALAIWAFPETPHIVVILMIVAISLYANLSRPETVLNLSVIVIPMIVLFITFLFLAIPDLVWSNLFPIGTSTTKEFIEGAKYSLLGFLGIEMYLIFRSYVNNSKQIKGWPLFLFTFSIVLFFLFSIILVLLYFSFDEIKIISEPILYLLKAQHVTFVERLDLFFIYIWMIWSIIVISLGSFTISFVHLGRYQKNSKRDIIIFHVLMVIIPSFLIYKEFIMTIKNQLIISHIIFSMIIPFFVIIRGKLKGLS